MDSQPTLTPDELQAKLTILRDLNVSRYRDSDFEVEWDRAPEEVDVPGFKPTPQHPKKNELPEEQSNYHKLFRGQLPTFGKAPE